MNFMQLVMAMMVANAAPALLALGAAVVVAGAIGTTRAFKSAAQSISNDIEAASETRRHAKQVALLEQDDTLPETFAAKDTIGQIVDLADWLQHPRAPGQELTDTAFNNLVACLQIYSEKESPRMYFGTGTDIIQPTLRFVDKYKDRLDPSVVGTITDKAVNSLKNTIAIDENVLNIAGDIHDRYAAILSPEHKEVCRSKVLEALEKPLSGGKKLYGNDFTIGLKALDILFRPNHSYGPAKSTAGLSLEKGDYSAEEHARAMKAAEKLVTVIKADTNTSFYWSTLGHTKRMDIKELLETVEKQTTGPAAAATAGQSPNLAKLAM